jgi:CBS domain containing-hemolysin-like protein
VDVVIGELVPKSVALQDPERTSLWIVRPITWAASLFRLPIRVLNGTANALLRLLGVEVGGRRQSVLSVEELRILVRSSEKVGVLEEDEREIIDAVFNIRHLVTGQVMVPRTEMQMVSADATLDELVRHAIETPFTKFPIYDNDADHIIGVVYIKDLVKALTSQKSDQMTARSLCTEAVFVPESLSVANLLNLLRESGEHIAMVYDEFGGTEGMVTLDDVLGKIVGDLPDRYEYDQLYGSGVTRRGGDHLVSGLMLIEDFNEEFDLDLSDENYNTIGGYVMGRLERIPRVGDAVKAEDVVLRVEAMDKLRIDQLSVERVASAQAAHPKESGAS